MNVQPALNNAPQKYLGGKRSNYFVGFMRIWGLGNSCTEALHGTSLNHKRVSKMEKHLQDRGNGNVTGD